MSEIESSVRETRRSYDIVAVPESSATRLREVPVADILAAAAETVASERARMNGLSSFANDGGYGDRMARAIADAATAVQRTGTGDAEDELEIAGQVLLDPMYTPAALAIGQGLIAASGQFEGRSGLTVADLQPILEGLLAGAQQTKGAEGTLAVFQPALGAYTAASQRNLTPGQTVQGVMGAARVGMRNSARQSKAGRENVAAVGAQATLTGMLKGLMGRRVPPTPQGESTDNFLLNLLNQGLDLFDLAAPEPDSKTEDTLALSRLANRYGE